MAIPYRWGWALLLLGCGNQLAGESTLRIRTDVATLAVDRQSLLAQFVASNADDSAGGGEVTLEASAGAFEKTKVTLDENGAAESRFTCDAQCIDSVELRATWKQTGATKTIRIEGKKSPTTPTMPPIAMDPLIVTGCTLIAADRPASSNNPAAPVVNSPAPLDLTAGSAINASLSFSDPQHDEKTLLVQRSGTTEHYRCVLTAPELMAGAALLNRFAIGSSHPAGVELLYLAIQDGEGNVSGYSTLTVRIGGGGTISTCQRSVQFVGSALSASTSFYARANGSLDSYVTVFGTHLTIVYRASAMIDLGGCRKLQLSSQKNGTGAVGWDDCAVFEVRAQTGAPVAAAWMYCSYGVPTLFKNNTMDAIPQPSMPTVAGNTLDPPVPNGAGFGFPAMEIDLRPLIPSTMNRFELTAYVLDNGAFGSTTEIWLNGR